MQRVCKLLIFAPSTRVLPFVFGFGHLQYLLAAKPIQNRSELRGVGSSRESFSPWPCFPRLSLALGTSGSPGARCRPQCSTPCVGGVILGRRIQARVRVQAIFMHLFVQFSCGVTEPAGICHDLCSFPVALEDMSSRSIDCVFQCHMRARDSGRRKLGSRSDGGAKQHLPPPRQRDASQESQRGGVLSLCEWIMGPLSTPL